MRERGKGYLGFAVLLAAAAAPVLASAAPADSAAERADSRRSRRDAAPATVKADGFTGTSLLVRSPLRTMMLQNKSAGILELPAEEKPTLTVTLAAPLTYNSNPEHASSNEDGDGHVDPSVDVTFEMPLKGALLTLEATADMDLNFDRPANDSTTLEGLANIDFETRRLGGAVPYLSYVVDDIYSGRFGDHDVTVHTFAAGLNYERAVTRAGASGKSVALSLNAEAGRRLASSAESEQSRFKVKGGLEGALTGRIGWSLKQAVLFKSYTGGANAGRDDLTLTTTGALKFKRADGLSLALTVQYEHNGSDRAGKDYSFWDIGPTLTKAF